MGRSGRKQRKKGKPKGVKGKERENEKTRGRREKERKERGSSGRRRLIRFPGGVRVGVRFNGASASLTSL